MSTVSSELIKKYNVACPRYTSYPTVPYWDQTPTQDEWISSIAEALESSRRIGSGAALYLHIPFCQSLCTYCGCNTRITRNHDVSKPYIQTLHKEWELYLSRLDTSALPLADLHLGGGTPTFLTPDELKSLIEPILEKSSLQGEVEFSLEADPRVTTREQLQTLARLGFKRLSLGIQDFDPRVQESVNRTQSVNDVRELVETARGLGYTSINFDLIYGLPFQTQDSIIQTIDHVRTLRPDRIAFYAYAHVPWIKPSQRRFTEADLPNGDSKRMLYELGRQMLEQAGYYEIGMDHFALETDSLWRAAKKSTLHRNFMGYIPRHVSPLIGLGVSSIGDSWNIFAQNEKNLESYTRLVESGLLPLLRGHVLSDEDRTLRRHILNLMTRFSTDSGPDQASTPFLNGLGERLAEAQKDGLIERNGDTYQITPRGVPFLRNICMAFDARLTRKTPETQIFSKLI